MQLICKVCEKRGAMLSCGGGWEGRRGTRVPTRPHWPAWPARLKPREKNERGKESKPLSGHFFSAAAVDTELFNSRAWTESQTNNITIKMTNK